VSNEVFRGRFRRSFEKPEPIAPNAVLEYAFSLHTQDYTFLKGHRLMVQVQSTWFPLIDRNPQTFVANIFQARAVDFHPATRNRMINKLRDIDTELSQSAAMIRKDEAALKREKDKTRRDFYRRRLSKYQEKLGELEIFYGTTHEELKKTIREIRAGEEEADQAPEDEKADVGLHVRAREPLEPIAQLGRHGAGGVDHTLRFLSQQILRSLTTEEAIL